MTSATLTLMKNKTKAKEAKDDANILTEVAHEIENLTQESAFQMVPTLVEDLEFNMFRLGGILSVINAHKWYGPHKNFKELVEKDFSLEYRKAMYLIDIYEKLLENDIPWDAVKDVGWTKLRVLAKHLTPENVDYWVAQAKKMTFIQLCEALKATISQKSGSGDAEETAPVTSTVTTLTFKVHTDQKEVVRAALDKIKEETKTEFDTVALEYLCTGYLGGNVDVSSSHDSIEDALKELGYEKVLDIFSNLWPEVNIVVEA